MKKLFVTTVLVLAPIVSFAHGNHPPKIATCAVKECTKEEIQIAVPRAAELLSTAGKIEGSWTTAKIENVEQKTFKKGPEWVATLLDEKQKDSKKQRLYIFITVKGYLNGSNFTGE